MLGARMRRILAALLLVVAATVAVAGCTRDLREERLDKLQQKLDADRASLQHEAETRDPTRTDLKASFVQSSIVQLRETNNPARPWVGYVRVQWHFQHADGRPIGDSLFDYVYYLDPQDHWIRADESTTPIPAPTAEKPKDGIAPLRSPAGAKPA